MSESSRADNLRNLAQRYSEAAVRLWKAADEIAPPLKTYTVVMEVAADVTIRVRATNQDTARQVASAAAAESLYSIDCGVEMWLDSDEAQALADSQGPSGNWTMAGSATNDERVSVLRITEDSDG